MGLFGDQLKHFRVEATKALEVGRREILLRLFRAVVYDTPVLTGRLRGDWQLTEGSPATGHTGIQGRTAGHQAFTRIQKKILESKFGDVIYLSNNMPYAYPIEFEGWSHTKAPEGMVRRNVIKLNSVAKAVSRGLNNGSIRY